MVSDVDSTLISEEVIDLLAQEAGTASQVAQITEAAMRGNLDFSDSLQARTRFLAGLDEAAFDRVYRQIHIRPGVRALVDWVHQQGAYFGVVSGGFTPVVRRLADDLGLDCFHANTLEVAEGKLTGKVSGEIVTAATKASLLQTWHQEFARDLSTGALGDGANDIPMLLQADCGVAIHSKPIVRETIGNYLDSPDLSAVIPMFAQFTNVPR